MSRGGRQPDLSDHRPVQQAAELAWLLETGTPPDEACRRVGVKPDTLKRRGHARGAATVSKTNPTDGKATP